MLTIQGPGEASSPLPPLSLRPAPCGDLRLFGRDAGGQGREKAARLDTSRSVVPGAWEGLVVGLEPSASPFRASGRWPLPEPHLQCNLGDTHTP